MGKRGIFPAATVIVAAFLVLAGVSGAAIAGYVLFYQHPGDWTVLCWREMSTQIKSCRLSAPSATLYTTKRQNVLEIRETAPDVFAVTIEVRDEGRRDLRGVFRPGHRPVDAGHERRGDQPRSNFRYLMRFGITASSPRRRFLSSS